jgi:hypothetical protein
MYAIIRLEGAALDLADQIAVTKVIATEQGASQEAERLNALNGEKGARYVVQITRLVE